MNGDAINNWAEANQRYLTARLAIVREALQRHAARAKEAFDLPAGESEPALREAAGAMPAPPALDQLCAAFNLSPFERDLLLLCAGMELDGEFAALCAAAQGNPQRAHPTFSMALAALPDAHWSALTPTAPLRRWRLVETGAGETLTTSPLRIDERVLHYLAGISYLDDRLQCLLEFQSPPGDLPPSHRAAADRIAGMWANAQPDALPVIHLAGEDRAAKRAVAASACAALGLQLYALRAADVPSQAAEREALARLWEREAALNRAALLVDFEEAENSRGAFQFLDHVRVCALATPREPLRLRERRVARLEISKPSAAEQRDLWRGSLTPLAAQLNGQLNENLDPLISQFDLGLEEIRAASAQVLVAANTPEPVEVGALLWDACRAAARGRLDDLAQRIEPVASWNDLVLPATQLQALRDIAAQVRQRTRVYQSWGFASKGARGLGISALFAGASGTGKTMAAEVLAGDLQLDLYRIDLSQVVSKYIGETEKNLRRVFDAAEAGGAILLFDEADALFGKRSEVKDSHDRYANIEISYLLQRMEAYRGLAILTTNLKNVLDAAFTRRLRFIVQFPLPDAGQRAEIWQRIFPAETPVEGLDIGKLARLNVTGGNIRNVALQAAFYAAESNEPVQMRHLLRAARSEYGKLEKQLTESEVREWL